MQAIDIDDYQRYMEILEANPGEFAELFNTILINVTGLLRDPEAWKVLAEKVIPRIMEAKGPGDPVRVWSAGTASGEEAYSLAVLLAEAFGEDRFCQSVKIYATDADNDALADARHDGGRPMEALFEQNVVAQVVIDASGNIVLANRAARRMFSIGSAELGRHLREAELYQRPTDLRAPIERAQRERRAIAIYDVPWHAQDNVRALDIVVAPLDGQPGLVISFLDASRYQHLRAELENSRHELETAYEELQSTVEELETTNEEFQSTNEELETTNEELHSTNEELETMNEELQSTNEELETINNEFRDRSAEVTELNQFLESILGSLQSAVVVLGTEMEVRAWNRQAEDLWGLRSDEVLNQHFLNLDIGFPVERLRTAIRNFLAGRTEHEQVTYPAVNRRGRPIECTVALSPLVGSGTTRGVILVMNVAPRDPGPAAGP
jgi:two-component system CheB/CheR fusion protein